MISLNFRSLTKCYTEKWRVRRDIKASTGSHGGTVGAWSKGGCLRVLLEINEQSVYLLSYQRTIRYISVALCAIGTFVIVRLFRSSLELCVPYYLRTLDYLRLDM